MKDALLEYETIDAGQIEDIMVGIKPRPPADWHDDDYRPGKPVESSDPKGSKPIGGPASEH